MRTILKYFLLFLAITMCAFALLDIQEADRSTAESGAEAVDTLVPEEDADATPTVKEVSESSLSSSDREAAASATKRVANRKSAEELVETPDVSERADESEQTEKAQAGEHAEDHSDGEEQAELVIDDTKDERPVKTYTGGLARESIAGDRQRVVSSEKSKVTDDSANETTEKPSQNDVHDLESAGTSVANPETVAIPDVLGAVAKDDEAEKNELAKQAVLQALDSINARLKKSHKAAKTKSGATAKTESPAKRKKKQSDIAEMEQSDVAEMEFGALGEVGAAFGMQMQPGRDSVTIGRLSPDGVAHRAGLRTGDTIVSVNRIPVLNTDEFAKAVSNHKSDSLDVFVKRGEAWRKLTLEIPSKK